MKTVVPGRGYFGIGVEGVSKAVNLRNLLRTAHAFGASFAFTLAADPRAFETRADTSKAAGHLPLYNWRSLDELALPKGCSLVGVELIETATELPLFAHPSRAAYIFGPERGALSAETLARCDHVSAFRPHSRSIWQRPAPSSCMTACARALASGLGHWLKAPRLARRASMCRAARSAAAAPWIEAAPVWPSLNRFCMVDSRSRRGDEEMHRTVRAACVIVALCCAPAHAQEAKLLQKFNDWSAYATSGGAKTCFAVSKPTESLPKGVKRGPIFIYISAYPSEGIKNEVSVKMGYPFKPGAMVTATVGTDKFELFTKDEGAFIEKPATETELIEAMKKGSQLKVEGTSARGTKTTDQYSLQGFGSALERVAQECNS